MFAQPWRTTLNKIFDLSIVVPVYNNEKTLSNLISKLNSFNKNFKGKLEIIFVVDGSQDKSLQLLEKNFKLIKASCKIVQLSRNFGSFEAIRCGLKLARGKYVVVKSADLQEPLRLIEDFYKLLESGAYDIVFGRRLSRSDGYVSDKFSSLYWWLYRKFINSEIPNGGVDIFGCSKKVAQLISQFPERNSSLLGLLFWVGFNRGYVDYTREKSLNEKGSWSLSRKVKYASDSVYSFTGMPVAIIQAIGLLGLSSSFVFSISIIFLKLTGEIEVPGYTSLMLVTLFSMSAILIAVGIVGSYAWRAFENSKQRISPIVRKIKE
jgi:glycosyltransferase involved in cell wall biosynthesis